MHVDKVEGLGNFMELEVVLNPRQTIEEGQLIAEDLMKRLGISKDSLLSGSYLDSLLKLTTKTIDSDNPLDSSDESSLSVE